MTKIIFVDVDGPMIPFRAVYLPTQTKLYSVFDPCATALLNKLLSKSGAKIVISSTWRKNGRDRCEKLLSDNGVDPTLLHDDWCTGYRMDGSRAYEIQAWLLSHPEVTHSVALEDEYLDPEIVPNAVQCCTYDGLSWRNYLEAKLMLDVDVNDSSKSQIDWFKRKEIKRTNRNRYDTSFDRFAEEKFPTFGVKDDHEE